MTYRTQSVRMLLAKLYRDLQLTDRSRDLDFVEWTGEALAHIGAFAQLEKKESVLTIAAHKAALPADLVQLLGVAYAPGTAAADLLEACKKPLPLSASTFHAGIHTASFKEGQLSEETFALTPGFIHTSYETGSVALAYLAMPLDEDGLPVVPDNPSFFDACKWYCATRLTEGGWEHPAGLRFADCEARWLKYCTQARGSANAFDMPHMDRFVESWVRLFTDFDAPGRFFSKEPPSREVPFSFNVQIDV